MISTDDHDGAHVSFSSATLASRIAWAASPERVEQARADLAAAMANEDIARGARLVEDAIARGACTQEMIRAAVRIITLAYQAEHSKARPPHWEENQND